MTALTNSSKVSLRGENDCAMGEKVCFSGLRMALVRLEVVVERESADGRRFCLGTGDLEGLQEERIDSMAIFSQDCCTRCGMFGQEDSRIFMFHGYHIVFHTSLAERVKRKEL